MHESDMDIMALQNEFLLKSTFTKFSEFETMTKTEFVLQHKSLRDWNMSYRPKPLDQLSDFVSALMLIKVT